MGKARKSLRPMLTTSRSGHWLIEPITSATSLERTHTFLGESVRCRPEAAGNHIHEAATLRSALLRYLPSDRMTL